MPMPHQNLFESYQLSIGWAAARKIHSLPPEKLRPHRRTTKHVSAGHSSIGFPCGIGGKVTACAQTSIECPRLHRRVVVTLLSSQALPATRQAANGALRSTEFEYLWTARNGTVARNRPITVAVLFGLHDRPLPVVMVAQWWKIVYLVWLIITGCFAGGWDKKTIISWTFPFSVVVGAIFTWFKVTSLSSSRAFGEAEQYDGLVFNENQLKWLAVIQKQFPNCVFWLRGENC